MPYRGSGGRDILSVSRPESRRQARRAPEDGRAIPSASAPIIASSGTFLHDIDKRMTLSEDDIPLSSIGTASAASSAGESPIYDYSRPVAEAAGSPVAEAAGSNYSSAIAEAAGTLANSLDMSAINVALADSIASMDAREALGIHGVRQVPVFLWLIELTNAFHVASSPTRLDIDFVCE